MNAHEELLTRAVSNVTPLELAKKKLKSGKPMRLYLGIDPTGSKLHLGHSVPLRKLKAFQDAGHEIVFLIGSFTGMIGDPTGRDEARTVLTRDDVEQNFQDYKEQACKILDFNNMRIEYNHEWLEKLKFDDIIDLASNFTVQQMLERDMFDKRMQEGKPISLHEFFYPLMVGYDSVILDVDCELGGNDQYFNMLAGRTLQTAYGKREKFVLTTKLIEGTDGRKMSKTFNNCIYLTDEANDMFGKVMSIKDDLITTYMECCTELSMEEVSNAEKSLAEGANPRDLKVTLALEIVRMYHGEEAAKSALENFETVFKNKGVPDDIPEHTVSAGTYRVIDLIKEAGLEQSKSQIRRIIEQGGLKIDGEKKQDINTEISVSNDPVVIQLGKRKFVKIVV